MPKKDGEAARQPASRAVQFSISPEDDSDFEQLVGELGQRAPVAKLLFLYALSNSKAAFAAYAEAHELRRRERLGEAGPDARSDLAEEE